MVAPIIGPTLSLVSTPELYDRKVSTKQARPIDRVLPYERKFVTAEKLAPTWGYDARALPVYDSVEQVFNKNRAYARMKSKLGDQAELALMLADTVKSSQMVTRRLYEFASIADAIASKNFERARRLVNHAAVPQGASVKKSFANNLLEFQFGWTPIVTDIFAALDVLQNQQVASFIQGSSQTPYSSIVKSKGMYTESSNVTEGITRCRMGARVEYTNKNLDIANRLGLVNPVTFVYDRIPFSFLLDWFVNVNQVCSSMTDFIGLSLSWTYTTYSWRVKRDFVSSNWFDPNNVTVSSSRTRGVYVKRNVGLEGPTLQAKPFNIGIGKAAIASALVVQQLNEKGYRDLRLQKPPKRYYNWGFNPSP